MNFQDFASALRSHFGSMLKNNTPDYLYQTDTDPDILWDVYLNSFPEGSNPVFRKRREYDCSCCRHFIRSVGNLVSIRSGVVTSLWDLDITDPVFSPVTTALSAYVKSKPIANVYYADSRTVGTAMSLERCEDGSIHTWNHFSLAIPSSLLSPARGIEKSAFQASMRDTRNVFFRSLSEFSMESLDTVLELIAQKSLYRGEEWDKHLRDFKAHKQVFDLLHTTEEKELYAWERAPYVGPVIGRIRNHSIGTLLVDLSSGMDLNTAVSRYEAIVAPANYKRPKAIFTQKMVEQARRKIEELGYLDSLERRFATLDDLSVNNVLFCDRDLSSSLRGGSVFDALSRQSVSAPQTFDRVQEITMDDFVSSVLPSARQVEVYLESQHAPHMVSLTAPKNDAAKPMFKWGNPFGWAYSGNLADSDIRSNVQKAGGKIDGALRFSIQWNDGEDYNPNDFDAHCSGPNGMHIYFGEKRHSPSKGQLDVDIIHPSKGSPAVENITWPSVNDMRCGKYRFYVHCFCYRGGTSGFRAEIEFNGQIHSFCYPHALQDDEIVEVATVELDQNGKFTLSPALNASVQSRDIWGLPANRFAPVSALLCSPNYWDGQNGIGHKHWFFMLKNCANPENPNGFYNEFLVNELMEHKRVFEALGSQLRIESSGDQLSGVGFCVGSNDSLVVRVTGATKRVLKIKF